MKSKRKQLAASITGLVLGVLAFPMVASAHMDQKQLNLDTVENNSQEYVSIIMAHAIGWRYKTIDGHVYRRQYDYSAQIWLGEWERC